MDFRALPTWAAWVFAVFGGGSMLSALAWMRAPSMRTRARAVSLGISLVVVLVFAGRANPVALWFAGGFFVIAALTLLPMGRLPPNMPLRGEPEYQRIARRGRLAGALLVVGEVAWIAFMVAAS